MFSTTLEISIIFISLGRYLDLGCNKLNGTVNCIDLNGKNYSGEGIVVVKLEKSTTFKCYEGGVQCSKTKLVVVSATKSLLLGLGIVLILLVLFLTVFIFKKENILKIKKIFWKLFPCVKIDDNLWKVVGEDDFSVTEPILVDFSSETHSLDSLEEKCFISRNENNTPV